MILDASIAGLPCFPFPMAWKIALACDFLHGLRLREMPCFKGFRGLSIIKAKKSFIFSSLFIGN